MGLAHLWDTNTVIYFLQKQFSQSAEDFIDTILKDSPPAISVITEIELLCWKTDNKKDLAILHDFIDNAKVFELEKDIKLKTAEIRKKYSTKLPDAVIAATAIIYKLELLSRNVNDFNKIEELSLIDPYDI